MFRQQVQVLSPMHNRVRVTHRGRSMVDDYTDKYTSGYYGTGKGIGTAAYQQGEQARARDEATWRASPNANWGGSTQSEPGSGAGVVVLLAVIGVLGLLWVARLFVLSIAISVPVVGLIVWTVLRLTGGRMAWRSALVQSGAAYGVAVVSALAFFLAAVGLAEAGLHLVPGTEHIIRVGAVDLPVPGPYAGLVAVVSGLMTGAWWLNRKLPASRLHGFLRWVGCGLAMVFALWVGYQSARYVLLVFAVA